MGSSLVCLSFLTSIFFLFQVSTYIRYLGRMASSANTSRTMQINLEKKCVELEGQLTWKDKALDSTTEKLSTGKENVALVVAEKDKQSADLAPF